MFENIKHSKTEEATVISRLVPMEHTKFPIE